MRWVVAAAVLVLAGAVAYPFITRATAIRQESAAAGRLQAIAAAQQAFRHAGGAGGYATDWRSLTQPCPGGGAAAWAAAVHEGVVRVEGYEFRLRPRADAAAGGVDCHGRPTAADYYVSARPIRPGADGSRGMATSADGRVYLFFDSVPPLEADMGPGGLATPLDQLEAH